MGVYLVVPIRVFWAVTLLVEELLGLRDLVLEGDRLAGMGDIFLYA